MNKLPEEFLNRMKSRLNSDFDDFVSAYEQPSVQSIRLNPKKKTNFFDELNRVQWYEEGRFLNQKKQFITDPLWHAGVYYVQESSSMILAAVFRQIYGENSPKSVLDLCAAPGGKSTLLQSLISDESVMTANEVIKSRAQILKENHIRLGISDKLIITQNDPRDFGKLNEVFDYVQIDAPCSGEGMFRKEEAALREWSEANCKLCTERQNRIIANVFPAVSKDGYIVYSTCTFNPDENEKLIYKICNEFEVESIQLNFDPDWKITEVNYNGVYGYYFYPHKVQGEGLFVSVMKKKSGYGLNLQSSLRKEKSSKIDFLIDDENIFQRNGHFHYESSELNNFKALISNKLNIIYSGIELGELKGKDFIPAQSMANFHKTLHLFPKIEVTETQALEFLRGNDPKLFPEEKGIYLLTYKNFELGWIKFIGNRTNNYYPKPWRIRNY